MQGVVWRRDVGTTAGDVYERPTLTHYLAALQGQNLTMLPPAMVCRAPCIVRRNALMYRELCTTPVCSG